jgi:cell division septum initiation protein DivIVA
MRNITILLIAALLVTTSGICRADNAGDVAKENAELRQRVERLEKELEELKKIVLQQAGTTVVETPKAESPKAQLSPAAEVPKPEPSKAQPSPVATPKLNEAELQKIAEMVQKETVKKKVVWSDLDVQIYGILRLDSSYDTSQVEPGNYIKWVKSEKDNKNDNQFDMTANQSRLGLKINGPEDDQLKTSGLLEVDFYGLGEENKATIKMRHGYLKLEWPNDRFDIIAGQTWDVISPLNPYTLNDTVMWYAGNIGYRRPQLRLTKSYSLGNDVNLKLEGALARTIGRKPSFTGAIDSGSDAGFPGMQARTSITFPWFGPKPTTIGISGHWAKEEYDTSDSGAHKNFDSWSTNLDVTQPISKWLAVKGELFNGENIDAYAGGIGQGVNLTTYQEIGSKGGWVAAELGPWDKWRFNVGAGVDSVDRGDVKTGDRLMNRSIFGNVIYSINKNAEVGFELSRWQTDYKGPGDADSLRAQTSLMYKF